jgi:hypothetical protein
MFRSSANVTIISIGSAFKVLKLPQHPLLHPILWSVVLYFYAVFASDDWFVTISHLGFTHLVFGVEYIPYR